MPHTAEQVADPWWPYADILRAETVSRPVNNADGRSHGVMTLEDAFAEGPAERARVLRVGLPDRYVTHGKPALLRAEVGLTGESVAERVLAAHPSQQPVLG